MSSTSTDDRKSYGEGWAFPGSAKKAHYFRDARSLCGRWFLPREPDTDGNKEVMRADCDCAACWKALQKELDA